MATTGMEGDLWIGSRSAGLYHSTDGGVSFTKIASVSGVDALGFGKARPEKTFLSFSCSAASTTVTPVTALTTPARRECALTTTSTNTAAPTFR